LHSPFRIVDVGKASRLFWNVAWSVRQVFETAFFYHIQSPVGKEIRGRARNIIQWNRTTAPGTRS